MLILGDKEVQSNTIGVRSRKDGDIGAMEIDKFISKVKAEVENYEKSKQFYKQKRSIQLNSNI